MNRFNLGFSIVSLAMLTACGSEPEPEATAAAQAAPVAKAPALAPDDPRVKMARAVGNGKPGAALEIRYEFVGKPAVGAPTELQIAFIPNPGVDAIEANIAGMDGITVAGPQTASFTAVEPGKPYTHTISVLPDRAGVFYVTVAASTHIGGSSLGRTFSIPFVVGNVSPQQKPEPQLDAAGEAIQPMEAKETRG
jgi:hypothetical protein